MTGSDDDHWWAKPPMGVIGQRELSDGAYRLWTWLDAKAGNTRLAKASYDEMAAKMRGEGQRPCSPKTIGRRLHELIDLGLLTLEREPAGHGRGWYRVVNPARHKGEGSVQQRPATTTDLSERATDESEQVDSSVPVEVVERTEVMPLLGSTRDLDKGSTREGRDAVAVALLERAFGEVEVVDCSRCDSPANALVSFGEVSLCEICGA